MMLGFWSSLGLFGNTDNPITNPDGIRLGIWGRLGIFGLAPTIDTSELFEEVADSTFYLETRPVLHGYVGRSNLTKVKFQLTTSELITLTDDKLFDFDNNNITKVIIRLDDQEISSEDGYVSWDGPELGFQLGAFEEVTTRIPIEVIVFVGEDSYGVVISGHGLKSEMTTTVLNV